MLEDEPEEAFEGEDPDAGEPEAGEGPDAGEGREQKAGTTSLEGLLDGGFDWVDLVRAYPIPALLLAAIGGFVIGRTRGEEVVEALSEFAASRVSQHVNEALGEELL